MSTRPSKPRRPGYIFLPLDVEFMEDDRIAAVGEKAAWLYLGMCLRSKQLVSDGKLTARHIERLPMTGTTTRLRALIKAGLVVEDAGQYVIPAWRSYNATATELQEATEKRLAGAALGNHRRWHEERGVVDPTCDLCSESVERVGTESCSESLPIATDSCSESPKREGEGEGEGEGETQAEAKTVRSIASLSEAEGFAAWYEAYPRKTARGRAAAAYRKALKKTDAPTLLSAVEKYRDARKGQDPQFTPHPATWLNDERWQDEAAPALTNADYLRMRVAPPGSNPHMAHLWEQA